MRIAGKLEYMPELRFTPSGKPLCTFDVRADTGQLVHCEVWEELGEELADLGLQPGVRLGMQGGFRNRYYGGGVKVRFVVREYAVVQ